MQKINPIIEKLEISDLLQAVENEKTPRRLEYIYRQVPDNNCQRCADCCFNCAEVYPIEFLNIYLHLKELPEISQNRLVKKIIRYELLHLTTLDHKCPFLEENQDCVVYEQRPLQCRLFGVYPEEDYDGMVKKSREENEKLAMYYARFNRLLLPQEVMTYDVEQCRNNIDSSGSATVMPLPARQRIASQILALGQQVFPDGELATELRRFSYQLALLFVDTDQLEETKVTVIKEYQAGGTSPTLDKFLAGPGVRF